MLAGVVLLLSPTLLSGFTLGAEVSQYSVGYVETTADGFEYSGGGHGAVDRDVLCWGSLSRSCQLERSLLDANVSVDHGEVYYSRHVDYRYLIHEDSFYAVESTGHELWLEPVNATQVLRRTARSGDDVPTSAMNAFEAGRVTLTTRADLPTNDLIDVGDGRYATLYGPQMSRPLLDRLLHPLDPLLGPIGFLAGLGLVLEGYHRRVVER